ncbi:MAG: restriction endonuclease [Gammaproteobacteria bacterium]
MNPQDKNKMLATLAELQDTTAPLDPIRAESMIKDVLQLLLRDDGYEIVRPPRGKSAGLDFIAQRSATAEHEMQALGIEFKYLPKGKRVGLGQVHQLIGAGISRAGIDRTVLVTNTTFSPAALELAQRGLPIPLSIELLDLSTLLSWAAGIREDDDSKDVEIEVREILHAMSRRFATLVARDPRALEHIEWRDLERLVAELFEGIGFEVTLTPPSKDGGKDVILECHVNGHHQDYIVEVKHWRTAVGSGKLRDFVNVVAREHRDGGLLLSSNGFTRTIFEQLSEIERKTVRLGGEEKILGLCNTYLKVQSGIWSPPENLVDVLYEKTLGTDS